MPVVPTPYTPDLHLHSIYSDGTHSVAALIPNAKAAGVSIFALTDHDSIKGCIEMKKILTKTHNARIEKALNRLSFLEERYGLCFTEEDMAELC